MYNYLLSGNVSTDSGIQNFKVQLNILYFQKAKNKDPPLR